MLRILGYEQSINVRKVLWTADELGLTYTHEAHWGRGAGGREDLLAINAKGLVPVLVDEALVLSESNTIVRYLAARYGTGELLATEPARRAEIEEMMDWQATDFNAAWRLAFQAYVRNNAAVGTAEQVAQSLKAWTAMVALLERRLATRRYVCGGAFTVADVVIGLSVNRYYQAAIPRPLFAAVEAYLTVLKARPAARRYLGGATD